MGIYVNPPNNLYPSKESWLIEHLVETKLLVEKTKAEFQSIGWENIPDDKVFLIVINNGAFIALLVVDCKEEYEYIRKMLITDKRQTFVVLGDKTTVMEYAT
jgi:hypothetical protein